MQLRDDSHALEALQNCVDAFRAVAHYLRNRRPSLIGAAEIFERAAREGVTFRAFLLDVWQADHSPDWHGEGQ